MPFASPISLILSLRTDNLVWEMSGADSKICVSEAALFTSKR